jgi:2-dehydro-3-deoxyphosphogluconate aldolase/(4S)-4-hydroxy-2-oxoglutarate aldolase
MATMLQIRQLIAASLERSPIIAVVRTKSIEEAGRQARSFVAAGLELIEITFTVPGASGLVRELLAERAARPERGTEAGPPWFGMGTVTTAARAQEALDAGAEFFVTPNTNPAVARLARESGTYLAMGAMTPTEMVAARELGADLVKVYPIPLVGGPAYLSVIRQPLDDIPMMASGGYGLEEIPAYGKAGATAFGIGAPLLGSSEEETRQRIAHALDLARQNRTRQQEER